MSKTRADKSKKVPAPKTTGKQGAKADLHKLERAAMLHNQGQFAEAEKIYREVLATDPKNQDALHLTGLLALQDQKFDTAKKFISKAIASAPIISIFHVSMGKTLEGLLDFPKAIESYAQAIKLDSNNIDAVFHLGNLYKNLGKFPEAESCYQKVLNHTPNHVATLNNLGNIYKDLGKFEQAFACYEKAIDSDPMAADLYINMGNAYKDMMMPQEAVNFYHKAIEVRPDFPDPYNNIGYILQHTGKLSDSIEYYKKALEITPDLPEVYHNLGNVYKDMGEFPEAIEAYRKAIVLRPDFTNAHSNILFAMNYDEKARPEEMVNEARKWWQQQTTHLADQYKPTNNPDPDRRLRIGYVSPDFCLHSVSFFFLSLLEKHDKNRFEIYCYSDVRRPDATTARLQGLADHWRQITGQPDEIVAQQVHDDQIDILFDLTGHTAYNRLLVFARGPAPIQVSWLGYPNTTGVETIQYRITDAIADPPGTSDPFYTEKLIRLPHCFLCYSPPEIAPDISELPAKKHQQITFGSFNNITKTSESVIRAWCHILNQVKNSQIILKSIAFADPETKKRYLDLFQKYGVEPERVILKKRTASPEEHLGLYNEIDIALDPFPYNGTTTTCEALWMGVPVIALRGDLHCSRVSASILTHTGLAHLIAETPEEYVDKAVSLARDLNELSEFRKNIRGLMQGSTLCNPEIFARDMESALRSMWTAWCKQDPTSTTQTEPGEHMTSTDMSNATHPEEKTNAALLLNRKGEELFAAGNIQEAAQLFEQAIALDPGCATAHNNLGVLSYHGGQLDKALQCFRKALEINPEDRAAIDNLGDILQAMQTLAPQQETNPERSAKGAAAAPILDREKTLTEIKKFPFWYHKIELPDGIVTPGWAPINPAAYRIPEDLTGKRVLDVGAWDGYWTFEALRRGAKEVIAIDDFSDYLGQLQESDRKAWATFDFCKRQLGYDDQRCKRFDMSIYDLSEETFGHFDIVFFFGTLYHLRHPLLALDKLAAVCDQEIFVETAILDDYSPYRGGLGQGYPGSNQMVMEFYPGSEYGSNDSNWWAPTLYCLINMLHAAGFNNCRGWKLTKNPKELPHCRGFAYGNKASSTA
ncbi:MAG: hypothetical protein A2520_06390 [Deltaproteobacteria bacterium RIFOXYD12_FULL_53_23]|nr:MAG: hypothetical protein A2520_06390 [Deltaproteobacteria bacterium RIFOXYD12_FULL_53_23]